jgi:hypothetical protein
MNGHMVDHSVACLEIFNTCRARSAAGDARSKLDGSRSMAGEEESMPTLDLRLVKINCGPAKLDLHLGMRNRGIADVKG